uniref:Uncharacterized protein n=1 Tax=Rhizophora mucronata TaxID=61149 RepID=A0A2P2QDJ3_RHIMU
MKHTNTKYMNTQDPSVLATTVSYCKHIQHKIQSK